MLKPVLTRTRLFLTGTVIFLVILIFEIFLLYKENVPCYYSETEDALPSVEDPSFSPKAKSIFFHETSCRSGLTGRQACAVEAAARAHPQRDIYVLFNAPVTEYKLKTGCLAELLAFPNVKFLRLHLAEYSKGTGVQSLLLNDVQHSRYRIQHTADILRILTLNKWGGIYLDTDMIVTRSLDDLPTNFLAKESPKDLGSGILSFAKDETGTRVTNDIIKEIINSEYDPTIWSFIGAEVIEYMLESLCPDVVDSPDYGTKAVSNCQGVMIFDFKLFYPLDYTEHDYLFSPPPANFDLRHSYTYHMWNFLNHNRTISRGTIYDLVAEAFCPSIHSKFYYELSTNTNT